MLAQAPDPDSAARPSRAKIVRALTAAHRRDVTTRAEKIRNVLTAPELRQPAPVQDAYAAIVTSQVALTTVLNAQIEWLGQVVEEHFGRHRDADIYTSLPGLGVILGARILGEFGDNPHRYADAKFRKAYAGTASITRASGMRRVVLARYARIKHLGDGLQQWAFRSLRGSPGARAYYQALRARKIDHQAALRQLANRWVGMLHGCLRYGTLYDERTAWEHHQHTAA